MYNLLHYRSQTKAKHHISPIIIMPSIIVLIFLVVNLMCNKQLVGTLAQQTSDDQQVPFGPRVIITPEKPTFSVDIKNPSSRVLTCQTSGADPRLFDQLKWSGPNNRNNWDELKAKHIVEEDTPNSNVWTLTFKNPTYEDAGTYYCRGTYQSSDAKEASIRVDIDTPITTTNCHERQFLIEGDTQSKVTCRISADSPRVQIKKDDILIDNSNKRYKWDNDDGLVINGAVNKSDEGYYKISVRSQRTGESLNKIIQVQVHSRPQIAPFNITEKDGHLHSIEGDKAILECKVNGSPPPLVYWYDTKLRNLTSVGGYHVNKEAGTLLIDRVDRNNDHGTFQCHAINSVGEDKRNITVSVDIKPDITQFNNVTADDGSEAHFECRASGQPEPVFSIRRSGNNSEPYRVGDGFLKESRTELETGGSNVYVHRMTILTSRAQHGLHYCNVTNRAGTSERVAQLFINQKPDLRLTPTEQYVNPKSDKKIAVTCHIKAYPHPIVTWRSDNTQIVNVESNVVMSPDQQTHIVTMSPPHRQAFSRLVCQAKNQMGESEQAIVLKYTTRPDVVTAELVSRGSTYVKLNLNVLNDGGDRIRHFKYRASGKSLDIFNPLTSFRSDNKNDTILDAKLGTSGVYTIKNLLPFYVYSLSISAVNGVDEGPTTEIRIETDKATRPEKPIIIRSSFDSTQNVFTSDYQNGYVLKWAPPESDNGDVISQYLIKFSKSGAHSDSFEKTIEQMKDRPLWARLGPLEVNQRYKIQIQAKNSYGLSEPDFIDVQTRASKPPMLELEPTALGWLLEQSTPAYIAIIAICVAAIIIIDLIFYFICQIGFSHWVRGRCCPTKTTSVISDKNFP